MEKMNLQMFAGEMNTQTTGGLSAEMKTYYGMELLENARPQLVHNQFAATKGLPVGGGKTVEWRKFGAFDKALTPLTEGVTPDGSGISVSYITKELAQYGDQVIYKDLPDDNTDGEIPIGISVSRSKYLLTDRANAWFTIPANCQHPENAKKFLEFMLEP